jgi:hypothetical protein
LQVGGERAKDGEALVQGRVLFHQLIDVLRNVLLLHYEDQVLLVRLQDDSEEKQRGGLLVGDSSISKHVSLFVNKEISPCEHYELGEYLRCTLSLHENGVENGDSFQSEGEALTEREELNINLGILNIELAEVSDIVAHYLLKELGFKQLVFEGVLVGSAEELDAVKSDFVFLDVRV